MQLADWILKIMLAKTDIQTDPSKEKVSLKDSILLLGSCFSDEIGSLLVENKLYALVNPFGTVFHPLSIVQLLKYCLSKQKLDLDLLFEKEADIWLHHEFSSKVYAESREKLVDEIEKQIDSTRAFLQCSSWVILTLGTAKGYLLKKNGKMVANCHKRDSDLFQSVVSDKDLIVNVFAEALSLLKDKKVILTVSPVRHVKDGLQENSISKSILRLACHELEASFSNVHYFPSYEIMMDDLRDYRFYKKDLIHPNDVAVEYIWDRFSNTFFDDSLIIFLKKWKKIKARLEHKPLFTNSKSHFTFLERLLEDLDRVEEVNVEEEKSWIMKKLERIK